MGNHLRVAGARFRKFRLVAATHAELLALDAGG
jgi:hypothetical protein